MEDELVFYCRDIHTLIPKLEEMFSSQGKVYIELKLNFVLNKIVF